MFFKVLVIFFVLRGLLIGGIWMKSMGVDFFVCVVVCLDLVRE